MEAAARQHGAGDVGACKSANVGSGEFFEMVGARSMHLDSEASRAGAGELFSMKTQSEAAGVRGRENFTGLSDGERAAVAEGIAEFGEIFRGDAR